MKSGRDHIEALRDGREIYINGEKIADVTKHPAFRNVVQSVGKLFDFASSAENRDLMTFEPPEGGRAHPQPAALPPPARFSKLSTPARMECAANFSSRQVRPDPWRPVALS